MRRAMEASMREQTNTQDLVSREEEELKESTACGVYRGRRTFDAGVDMLQNRLEADLMEHVRDVKSLSVETGDYLEGTSGIPHFPYYAHREVL